MKKIFSLPFFALATFCLLFVACEKEQVQPVSLVQVDKAQLAKSYLNNSPTMLTFAVLEIDHETFNINGFVMDKYSNVRAINMEEATFLDFEQADLLNYFTERMFEKSEPIETVDIEVMAENVKKSRNISTHDNFEIDAARGNTSKIYIAFQPNAYTADHGDCSGDGTSETQTSVSKLILSASGQISYEPTMDRKVALVSWLQSFESEVEGN